MKASSEASAEAITLRLQQFAFVDALFMFIRTFDNSFYSASLLINIHKVSLQKQLTEVAAYSLN